MGVTAPSHFPSGFPGPHLGPAPHGFDLNAAYHFQALSNQLSSPKTFLCPAEKWRPEAATFHNFSATNVTYFLRSGSKVSETFRRKSSPGAHFTTIRSMPMAP